ncbi:MAG: IS66 family insertion sequence element accessory protein TnpB [Chthoniobacterales bacterium]|nr:IS66 family insertion sequence element accessory protein TnpB [Chthoniobacterales bacterium]
MITPAVGAQVYLAITPVDMRRGIFGLASLVEKDFGISPFTGALFVFRGKRGDAVKILAWDGSGMCLFAKRLEQGRFVWPPIVEGRLLLSAAQLALLLEGIDWRRTVAPEPAKRPEYV